MYNDVLLCFSTYNIPMQYCDNNRNVSVAIITCSSLFLTSPNPRSTAPYRTPRSTAVEWLLMSTAIAIFYVRKFEAMED